MLAMQHLGAEQAELQVLFVRLQHNRQIGNISVISGFLERCNVALRQQVLELRGCGNARSPCRAASAKHFEPARRGVPPTHKDPRRSSARRARAPGTPIYPGAVADLAAAESLRSDHGQAGSPAEAIVRHVQLADPHAQRSLTSQRQLPLRAHHSRPEHRARRQGFTPSPRLHIAARRILDRLELALAGHARALRPGPSSSEHARGSSRSSRATSCPWSRSRRR